MRQVEPARGQAMEVVALEQDARAPERVEGIARGLDFGHRLDRRDVDAERRGGGRVGFVADASGRIQAGAKEVAHVGRRVDDQRRARAKDRRRDANRSGRRQAPERERSVEQRPGLLLAADRAGESVACHRRRAQSNPYSNSPSLAASLTAFSASPLLSRCRYSSEMRGSTVLVRIASSTRPPDSASVPRETISLTTSSPYSNGMPWLAATRFLILPSCRRTMLPIISSESG